MLIDFEVDSRRVMRQVFRLHRETNIQLRRTPYDALTRSAAQARGPVWSGATWEITRPLCISVWILNIWRSRPSRFTTSNRPLSPVRWRGRPFAFAPAG